MEIGFVNDPIYLEHETGAHVENKHRLVSINSLLEQTGLMKQLKSLSPRAATMTELLTIHSQEHIDRIESFAQGGGGWLDGDTVASTGSYKAAIYAVGGLLRAVDAVLNREVDSAFAAVRPPGHHATPERAMGFCLFNNVAIAARYAQQCHGINRVLIVDFDVHHGNGTQDAFYSDSQVLYFSTHQYPFYPGTGAYDEIGSGQGRSKTVNVPLPAGCGDTQYAQVYREILMPIARRFRPELILVSAGYDCHWADQIATMQLSISGFAEIMTIIKSIADELCNGRLVVTLEGGYNLEAISHGVKAGLDVLLNNPLSEDPMGEPPCSEQAPSVSAVLSNVKQIHGIA